MRDEYHIQAYYSVSQAPADERLWNVLVDKKTRSHETNDQFRRGANERDYTVQNFVLCARQFLSSSYRLMDLNNNSFTEGNRDTSNTCRCLQKSYVNQSMAWF